MENQNNSNYLFSILNGFNYYKVHSVSDNSISAFHCKTDIEIDIYCEKYVARDLNLLRQYIENPPTNESFIWPIDIVELYDTKYKSKGSVGFVFKKRAYPKLETLKSFVWDDMKLGWEKEDVIQLSINLLKLLIELKADGYVYNAFNLDKIYYEPGTYQIYFNYSLSTTIYQDDIMQKHKMLKDDRCIDYLPPWYRTDDSDCYVNSNQNLFSVAALFFKMFIGRMPYQGRLFDGCGDILDCVRDTDEKLHTESIEKYLEIDNFIFDEKDDCNKIGTFSNEQQQIDRWNSLERHVRTMFYNVFTNSNKSSENKNMYSLEEWYNAILYLKEHIGEKNGK